MCGDWKQQDTLKEQRNEVRIWKTAGNGGKGRIMQSLAGPVLGYMKMEAMTRLTNSTLNKRKGKSLPVILKKDQMSEIIPDSSDSVSEPSGQTPSAEIPVA